MTPTEYEHEPIRGLPGHLPPGERIVWQGSPEWRVFARSALFTRWIGAYFALLVAIALTTGSLFGALGTAIAGLAGVGLLAGFARLVANTTVYTLTNRRVVLRIGVALTKCINLPLTQVASASLRDRGTGHGDIALGLEGRHRLGYAMLWPHARPFRLGNPEPMLRALPDAATVAALLAEARTEISPIDIAAPAPHSPAVNRPFREAAA